MQRYWLPGIARLSQWVCSKCSSVQTAMRAYHDKLRVLRGARKQRPWGQQECSPQSQQSHKLTQWDFAFAQELNSTQGFCTRECMRVCARQRRRCGRASVAQKAGTNYSNITTTMATTAVVDLIT